MTKNQKLLSADQLGKENRAIILTYEAQEYD